MGRGTVPNRIQFRQLHWVAEVKNSMRHFGVDDCQFNNLALCLCW